MRPPITTSKELQALTASVAASPVLALDTEFLRERTYRPQLCLVQLCDGQQSACIDPLALEDLNLLATRLTDRSQTKVLHAAGQDVEVLFQRLGVMPAPLFDTQIAATLCGLGEQLGYAALIERLLGVHLAKAHSRTDWSHRPLSEAQIRYALEDVHYLPEAQQRLQERLVELGRLTWLQEDCAALLDPARWTPDPFEAWRRVKGWQRLPAKAFPRLRHLAAWRERHAMQLDRPRRWVLEDENLLQLANRPPANIHALVHGKLLPPNLFGVAEEIMAALEAARQDTSLPPSWSPLRAEERRRFERLAQALERMAITLSLPAGLLLSRGELERLARGQTTPDHLTGWRAGLLRETLAQAL